MRITRTRSHAWGFTLALAIVMAGTPALAQTSEGLSKDMTPPSELDADSSAALARTEHAARQTGADEVRRSQRQAEEAMRLIEASTPEM